MSAAVPILRLSDMAGEPPRVTVSEPTGLGAVVLADDGEPWTKWNDWLWRSRWAPYQDGEWGTFSAVRVLSAGVEVPDAAK